MAPAVQRSSSLIRRSHSAGQFLSIPEAPAVPYTSNSPGKAVDIAWIGMEKFGPNIKVGLLVLHSSQCAHGFMKQPLSKCLAHHDST